MLGAAVAFVFAFAFVPFAQAHGPTATVTVSAFVPNGCAFTTSTDDVDFGAYNPVGANATAALTQNYVARYNCTSSDVAYTFSFSSLNQAGGQCRITLDASAFLNYNITDAASQNFTCNGSTGASAHGQSTGAGHLETTYAFTFTIPPGQHAVRGTYIDTLTITIAG